VNADKGMASPLRKSKIPTRKSPFLRGDANSRQGNGISVEEDLNFVMEMAFSDKEKQNPSALASYPHRLKKICNILPVSSVYIGEGL